MNKKRRPTWDSLSEKTGSGYVPAGTSTTIWGTRVKEFVEHDCTPPAGTGSWTCGCGRVWR